MYKNSVDGGIYKIVNKINNRIYIGSTKSFKTRFKNHYNTLTSNKHHNKFMQNDFNKTFCENNFLFEVIEIENDKNKRFEKEQHYIDKHYDNQKQCYNLSKNANLSREGLKNKKTPNVSIDKRCKSPSAEILNKRTAKIREVRGTTESSEKSKVSAKNQWAKYSANISVINCTTQEIVLITGTVRQFCLFHNLSYKSFNQLVNKKIKTSGGWRLLENS
jgi:group I intron endonuclease